MYLFGGPVERGEAADQERVVLAPVRKLGGADARPGRGPVLVLEEVEKGLVRRHRTGEDRLRSLGSQPSPLGLRNPLGERSEGRVEDARLGVLDQVARDRHLVPLEHHSGYGHPELHAAPHEGDVILEGAGNVAEQRDVGVVVGDRAQRQRVRQPRHPDVEPGIRVDREEVAAELRVTDPLGERRLEDVPVHQVLVGKPPAGDLEQPIPETAHRRRAPLDVRFGHRPESRRRNAVERGRETGLLLAAELHEIVEERVERAVGLR